MTQIWQARLLSARNLHYVAALLICATYFANLHFNPALSARNDLYFGADCERVLENLRNSDVVWTHDRDRLHPFFSIFAVTTARIPAAMGIAGMEFVFYRLVFGTAAALLFFALVYEETSALQAFASLVMLLSSFSLRLWSTLPESFLFGFFTIMLALYLIRARASPVAVLIASMASATTNLAVGLIHVLTSGATLKRIVQIALLSISVAVMIDIIQINVYPSSDYFFNVLALRDETRYLSRNLSALPFRSFDFLFSGFSMPLQLSLAPPIDSRGEWNAFLQHGFWSKRATCAVVVAIVSVGALYLSSAVAFIFNKRRTALNTALGGFILFEFVFHLLYGESPYGDSPFLYSLHFIPVIILFFSVNRLERLKAVYPPAFLLMALLFQYVNLYNFNAIFH